MRIFGPIRQPVFLPCLLLLLSLTAATAVAQNDLVVASQYGTPTPGVGTNTYAGPSNLVICTVLDSPVLDTNNTRYVCTGWTGTGDVPPSGIGTNVSFWMDENSSITWQWQTQYLFSAVSSSSNNGSVTAANGWYAINSVVSASATPSNNYLFSGWFGDVPAGRQLDNPLDNLVMDQPRIITGLFSRVMYVSKTGSGVQPYATWSTAATTIEAALGIASPGMTIMVSNGTYSIAAEIELTNSVTIKGFAGPSVTIVERTGTGRVFRVTAGSSVEGLAIRNGDVTAGGPSFTDFWGGGVFLDHGGTVSNCIVTANQAEKGGGVYCYDGGIVEASVVTSNTATTAGMSGLGGGVFCLSNGTVRSCLITHNVADYGGGVRCEYGGAIWSSTISTNTANVQGGGAYMLSGGELRNTIIYYNSTPLFPAAPNYQNSGSGTKYYSCCTTPEVIAAYNGGGNITTPPQFADLAGGDYSLKPASPCVDTGAYAAWMDTALDLAGTNRVLNGAVDRGAYEFVPPMITSWAGPNGAVTPGGTYTEVSNTNGIQVVSVTYSNNITYSIVPALYYRVDDVVVDGSSVGPTNSYTFTGVTSNHTIYATFVLNRPTLIVSSLYGSTVPPIGTNEYEAGSILLCMILNTDGVTNGTTRYMFTGWTGTGDAPASGSGSSFDFTINVDSTVTWGWKTQYLFTATSSSTNGIVSPSNAWYDAGQSNVMVTATPAPGYRFVNWTGDLPATNANDNPLYLTMDQARSVTGHFEIIRVTLTVNTPVDGAPSPGVGTWTNDWGTSVTCLIANATIAEGTKTQHLCTGWVGTGDVPASGSGTTVSFVHLTDSTITWQWKTQYRVYTAASGSGVVTPVLVEPFNWFDAGSVVQITATPFSPGPTEAYRFVRWLGDVPTNQIYDNPLSLLIDQSRSVTGLFEPVPKVMYVSPGGSHTFPFADWATAATDINSAVDRGGLGSVINVGDGTYTLTATINMDDDITLISANGSGPTIIDGNGMYRCLSVTHENAVVDGFTIRNGSASVGAGVYITDGGTVRRCTIENNDADNRGGGVLIEYSGSLEHCIIQNNTATNYGAGVAIKSGGLARNCLVIRNGSLTAPTEGGGIYCDEGGTIESCTVATNMANAGGGGVYLDYGGTVTNTIVYYNMTTGDPDDHNCLTNGHRIIAYSCSYPLEIGTNNISLFPKFADIDTDNYTLMQGSPCIDAGITQSWMGTSVDLGGNARVQGTTVNIGAYEDYLPVHIITATLTAGGTMTPNGLVAVADGGNMTFTIAATGTYQIANVVVDSNPIGATNSYTFTSVTADHTIHAVFTDSGATNAPLGTPIWWLSSFGLDSSEEQTDYDGDGHQAWEEYIADTDPTKGSSYLRITDVSVLGNGYHVVTWTSSAARVYSLLSMTDIMSGTWNYLAGHTNIPGIAGSMSRTNTSPSSMQFYRVGVSLP